MFFFFWERPRGQHRAATGRLDTKHEERNQNRKKKHLYQSVYVPVRACVCVCVCAGVLMNCVCV